MGDGPVAELNGAELNAVIAGAAHIGQTRLGRERGSDVGRSGYAGCQRPENLSAIGLQRDGDAVIDVVLQGLRGAGELNDAVGFGERL